MKNDTQKHNWLLDAILFVAFILTFFLDLTGVPLHQWLGMAAGAAAVEDRPVRALDRAGGARTRVRAAATANDRFFAGQDGAIAGKRPRAA